MKTDILIIGAGIGGFACLKKLNKTVKNKKILLVDSNNFLTFAPMLHEVASGSIQPNHCTLPIREYIHKSKNQFLKATVKKINPLTNTAETDQGDIQYQYCIIATGSQVNFFNTPGTKEFSHHVRTLAAARKLHQALIRNLEDPDKQLIQINIVGGGATGVELAGQFADLATHEVKKLYPHKKININLIQSGNHIIQYTHPKIQKKASKKLQELGVKIMLNSRVEKISKNQIFIQNGPKIQSDITAWTAGFKCLGNKLLPQEYCEKGRIKVSPCLRVENSKNLFAIGDVAITNNSTTRAPYPQTGEIAQKQGVHLAKNLAKKFQKKEMKAFTYQSKGTLIPIGEWFALAEIGKLRFSGRFAWWLRRTVYLMSMPGTLRKLRIVIDWTLNCFAMRNLNESE